MSSSEVKQGACCFAREGRTIIGMALVLCALGFWWQWLAGVFFLVWLLFSLNFFRNPKRTPLGDESDLVSPADGRVLEVITVTENRFLGGAPMQRISIFMSPLNVHVNRIPMDGTIERVIYNPGKYFAAFSEKASLDNEQNAVVLHNKRGDKIVFIQIAGFLARRIICLARPGESWKRGDVFGMIKFGSRADVMVPMNYEVKVKKDQHVKAGETILARALIPEE